MWPFKKRGVVDEVCALIGVDIMENPDQWSKSTCGYNTSYSNKTKGLTFSHWHGARVNYKVNEHIVSNRWGAKLVDAYNTRGLATIRDKLRNTNEPAILPGGRCTLAPIAT